MMPNQSLPSPRNSSCFFMVCLLCAGSTGDASGGDPHWRQGTVYSCIPRLRHSASTPASFSKTGASTEGSQSLGCYRYGYLYGSLAALRAIREASGQACGEHTV